MKKKIAAFLVGTLTAAMILGGCGTDESTEELSVSEETEDEVISAERMLESTDYDVTKYVTLPENYLELTVELKNDYEVTDEDVREYVEEYILDYYPMDVASDKKTVEDGDIADIDYVGTLDGEAFDGGTAEGYHLSIGSGTFIDGFEDGLIGCEVGTTVDLALTFPESYSNEDLAGQDVVFTVTINAILEEITLAYDEITDDYVEQNFSSYGMTTVEDLMADVEETLEETNAVYQKSEIQDLVLEMLVEESVIDYPETLLDKRVEEELTYYQESAQAYDVDYEEFVVSYYGYDSVDEFEEAIHEMMEEYLPQELVLEAIVADLDLSITRSDYQEFVDTYIAYYGLESEEDFYAYYGEELYVMLGYAESQALTECVNGATVYDQNGDIVND